MSQATLRRLPILLAYVTLAILLVIDSSYQNRPSDGFVLGIVMLPLLSWMFEQTWKQLDAQGKQMRQLENELASRGQAIPGSSNAEDRIRLP